MPIVKPATDLQRNIGSIYDLARETKEPIYITRNGETNLVVMDAASFDERFAFERLSFEREMRTYRSLTRARADVEAGRLTPFEDVRRNA